MQEYEAKFLDIDPDKIRTQLKQLGAKLVFSMTYHRLNFEYPDWRLDKNHSWLRLRNEGDNITLAYKKRLGPGQGNNGDDLGMEEIEVTVDDFDKTKDIFLAIGFILKFDIENKRERWIYQDIQFDIDTYPLIPTYIEIESSSWSKVDKGIKLIGLDSDKKKICSANQIYANYDIKVDEYIIMHFDKQIKRKK